MRGTSSDDCAVVCEWRCSLNNKLQILPSRQLCGASLPGIGVENPIKCKARSRLV